MSNTSGEAAEQVVRMSLDGAEVAVKLAGAEGDITGSYADDYLVYTNAKVNHDFLKNGGN